MRAKTETGKAVMLLKVKTTDNFFNKYYEQADKYEKGKTKTTSVTWDTKDWCDNICEVVYFNENVTEEELYELPKEIFDNEDLLKMGHFQRIEDHNLGLGWLYYSIARIVRPRLVVVIGSWRGFAPLVFGRAMMDNLEDGQMIFIDPSLVDDFWKDAESVKEYFRDFGVNNINHYLMTTQQFVESETYKSLADIGVVFIDGYHSKEQAKYDYNAFQHLLSDNGMILLHDSISDCNSPIYGEDKVYEHQVRFFVKELAQNPELQVFDFPFDFGVTIVRKATTGSNDY